MATSAVGAGNAENAAASPVISFGRIWANLVGFEQYLGENWAKVIDIWANLVRFG